MIFDSVARFFESLSHKHTHKETPMIAQAILVTVAVASKTLASDQIAVPTPVESALDIATELLGREPELAFVGQDNGGKVSINVLADGNQIHAFDYQLPEAEETTLSIVEAIIGKKPPLTIDVKAVVPTAGSGV